jgi:anaerobic glycerol-3-phosphate dehydrogenase
MHHICESGVNNDNIHQSVQAISSDKDIHSLLNVAKKKVGNLLFNMCSTLQNNNFDNVFKCNIGCYTFTPVGASKQMGT